MSKWHMFQFPFEIGSMKHGTLRRLGRHGALKKALFQFPRRQLGRGGALKRHFSSSLISFPAHWNVNWIELVPSKSIFQGSIDRFLE